METTSPNNSVYHEDNHEELEEIRKANHKRWMILQQLHREWNLQHLATNDNAIHAQEDEDTRRQIALQVDLEHTTKIIRGKDHSSCNSNNSDNNNTLDFSTELVESYTELSETNTILQNQILHETMKLQDTQKEIEQQYQIQQQLLRQQEDGKEIIQDTNSTTRTPPNTAIISSSVSLVLPNNHVDTCVQQHDEKIKTKHDNSPPPIDTPPPEEKDSASSASSPQSSWKHHNRPENSLPQEENQWLRSELAYIAQCYETTTHGDDPTAITNNNNNNNDNHDSQDSSSTSPKKKKKIKSSTGTTTRTPKRQRTTQPHEEETNHNKKKLYWSLDELVLKLMDQYLASSSSSSSSLPPHQNSHDPYLLPNEQHLPINPKHIDLLWRKCQVIQGKSEKKEEDNYTSSMVSASSSSPLPSWIRLVDYLE